MCKNTYYASRSAILGKKRTEIKMHREIIKPPSNMVVDHINHNGLDNRHVNIRPATHAQNCRNRTFIKKKGATSKYKGVTWAKHVKKWRVRVHINYGYKSIGYFDDEISAAKAYDTAAKKYHKEFAVLNFPPY